MVMQKYPINNITMLRYYVRLCSFVCEDVGKLKIIILNKIENRLDEYVNRTGSTKTWIAKQLDMSKQNLNYLSKSENITLRKLIEVAVFLELDVDELYEYYIVETEEE